MAGHGDHLLDFIVRRARDTAAADFGTLALVVAPGWLQVKAIIGVMAGGLVGRMVHMRSGPVGRVALTSTPLLTTGATDTTDLPARAGPVVVPITVDDSVMGTLTDRKSVV